MDCRELDERLPWFLNGTLSAGERDAAEAHLQACPECRTALGEVFEVARMAAEHPAIGTLIDYVFVGDAGDETLHEHLLRCADCAEQVSLLRYSRSLEHVEPLPAERPQAAPWRPAALAASVLCVVLAGAWWLTWLEQARKLRELSGPRLNEPVVELIPEIVVRGENAAAVASVPGDHASLTLILSLVGRDPGTTPSFELELRDHGGALLWQASDLELQEETLDFTLVVPRSLLAGAGAAGPFEIRVFGSDAERREVARYRFRLEHGG